MTAEDNNAEVSEFIRNIVGQHLEVLAKSVIPIFIADRKDRIALEGSGVLIAFGGHGYLCTANHVIEANEKGHSLYYDASGKSRLLEAEFRFNKDLDIAACRLSQAQIDSMSAPAFIDLNNIEYSTSGKIRQYANVIGFPGSRSKVPYGSSILKSEKYSFSGLVREEDSTSLYVDFDKYKVFSEIEGDTQASPDPYGMSGGGIFCVPIGLELISNGAKPKLVAISVKWVERTKRIKGTHIAAILNLIQDLSKSAL